VLFDSWAIGDYRTLFSDDGAKRQLALTIKNSIIVSSLPPTLDLERRGASKKLKIGLFWL